MIIKVASTFEAATDDQISLTLPNQSTSYKHYPKFAKQFFNVLSTALTKARLNSTYNETTGMGTVNGIPIMVIHSMNKVYFWWYGMDSSVNSISTEYTGLTSGCRQSLGVTIKGTKSSFIVYIGTGSSLGAETFAFGQITLLKMSNNSSVKAYLSTSKTAPILYLESSTAFISSVPLVRPSTDNVQTGDGYGGFALVPAVTCDMAYMLTDCYLDAPAILTDNSYYTIAGTSVVVVNNSLLLKC